MNELATIKKSGDASELITKQEAEFRIKEIARCKRDIVYFAEKYFRVINLDKGLHIIKLYDVQKDFLRFLVDHNRVICCSGRQQGKCVCGNTLIKVRNRGTGEILDVSAADFYLDGPAFDLDGKSTVENGFGENKRARGRLSDAIERKFEGVKARSGYQVLTDGGWEDVSFIGKTVKYAVWTLVTEKHRLKCADTHIVFDESMNEVFVKDLKKGDLVATDSGLERVVDVYAEPVEENMYDVQLAEGTSRRYFTNGVLSHNSTIYCIYSLWLTTFYPEKKVMILANKAATSLELLEKINMAWSYLPHWLKCSATVINKGELSFGNKSSIRGFASSSDAARGFSANCVEKNTKITIRLFKFLKLTVPIKWMKYLCW